MIEALNIATMPIADKVQRHMMASYYALQLDALEAEAKRLGYFFAQADTAATMPPVLADCLARAVIFRRESYLYPENPEDWEWRTNGSMGDGFGPETLRAMLAALAALGIRLQESPQAAALLAAEECRQREAASVPPEPEPAPVLASGTDVARFVDEFFDSLDAPKEEATP
ncbi:hypothetical protein AFAE65S_04276 [Alcaligenes phenolicus]